jgi:hypothetical protein
MADERDTDARRTGHILLICGNALIAIGVLVVLWDLPTPGGNLMGHREQNILLLFFSGAMLVLASVPNLRGGRNNGTETLRAPGPIEADDGPTGAG